MTETAVASTLGSVWHARPEWMKLAPQAREVYANADGGRVAICGSAWTSVELAEAARRGGVRFPDSFSRWASRVASPGGVFSVGRTAGTGPRAEERYAVPERSNRSPTATAVQLGHPLLTREPEIRLLAGIQVIW